jgi:hypothetical protein
LLIDLLLTEALVEKNNSIGWRFLGTCRLEVGHGVKLVPPPVNFFNEELWNLGRLVPNFLVRIFAFFFLVITVQVVPVSDHEDAVFKLECFVVCEDRLND